DLHNINPMNKFSHLFLRLISYFFITIMNNNNYYNNNNNNNNNTNNNNNPYNNNFLIFNYTYRPYHLNFKTNFYSLYSNLKINSNFYLNLNLNLDLTVNVNPNLNVNLNPALPILNFNKKSNNFANNNMNSTNYMI